VYKRQKEYLEEKYWKDSLNTVEIAKECSCDRKTIEYWMNKFGIERRSISEALKGRKLSEEVRQKMSEGRKGMEFTKEHRRNISEALIGEKSPSWKGGCQRTLRRYSRQAFMEYYELESIPKGIHIHHRNKNRRDMSQENLEPLSKSNHHKLHEMLRKYERLEKQIKVLTLQMRCYVGERQWQ